MIDNQLPAQYSTESKETSTLNAVPFLTFQPSRGQSASEAMQFYVDLFGGAQIVFEQRRGADDVGAEGTVFLAEFVVAGQRFRCSDSAIGHDWDFSPAMSIWVACSSSDQQQHLFDALSANGGVAHMPVGDYGLGPFGGVQDRFGVNWQLAVSSSSAGDESR
jgi:predicted 3-demethylubiquinone-9 3-methyltransferase (glyoxalase superfamily)